MPANKTRKRTQTHAADLQLSARAAQHIAKLLRTKPAGTKLRVAVFGGGCSGFQYDFSMDARRRKDDLVVARDGVEVLVDAVSQPYLKGAELDWVEDLIGASFRIRNPNARTACGCGNSFAL